MPVECSIIITHINCPAMLQGVITHAKTHKHPQVKCEYLVADQSIPQVHENIKKRYANDPEIRIFRYPKVDAGYPIDRAVQEAKYEYCCTLDIDAFPIHPKWLWLPIQLIEKFGFSMVGHRTGLDMAYPHKGVFFELNNYFRVSKTSLIKHLSEQVGIMRPNARAQAGFKPKNVEYEACNLGDDKHHIGNYADTGVVANWLMDHKLMGTKLSLCMTKLLGICDEYGGAYGMVLDDLVFHLVLGYSEDYMTPQQMQKLGTNFLRVKKLVNEGPTLKVIKELVAACKDHSKARAMTKIENKKVVFAPPPKEVMDFIDQEKMTP